MSDGDGDLSKFREIAVVLGGGLHADGSPTTSTILRADAAAVLAKSRPLAVIVSGSHGDGPTPERTEAEIMGARIAAAGVERSRIFLEDRSRDTPSNAAFVAQRYLAKVSPRPLVIVTSPFHMKRALATFAMVLGPDWPLESYASAAGTNEDAHAATEEKYLDSTRARLEGLVPGDLPRIIERLSR